MPVSGPVRMWRHVAFSAQAERGIIKHGLATYSMDRDSPSPHFLESIPAMAILKRPKDLRQSDFLGVRACFVAGRDARSHSIFA